MGINSSKEDLIETSRWTKRWMTTPRVQKANKKTIGAGDYNWSKIESLKGEQKVILSDMTNVKGRLEQACWLRFKHLKPK